MVLCRGCKNERSVKYDGEKETQTKMTFTLDSVIVAEHIAYQALFDIS